MQASGSAKPIYPNNQKKEKYMLILTRKIGQQVLIGGGSIQVKILKADEDVITIGFIAPAHIDIDREEIFVRKNLERMLAKHAAIA